jgi:hypothetical protein
VREAFGDLWALEADARCVTTNGYVTRAGRGVMGRGVAAQAKARFPGIEKALGQLVTRNGNHVQTIAWWNGSPIIAFPVKHHWHEAADLALIERSARELVVLVDARILTFGPHSMVLLPRPGCGNGRLAWPDVRAVIEPVLDDRIVVVALPEEADA